MRKKLYAVKNGRKTGIFNSWDECKKQVDGYSGAEYKSFLSIDDANAYIEGRTNNSAAKANNDEKCVAYAYVDGSFNDKDTLITGGGGVLFFNGEKHLFAVNTECKELVEMRNVGGEIMSTVAAVELAKKLGANSLRIYHDYSGIAAWAKGDWKANKQATKAYARFMQSNTISVDFTQVKGHSGVDGNELADLIAKYSIGLLTHDEYYDKLLPHGKLSINKADLKWLNVEMNKHKGTEIER